MGKINVLEKHIAELIAAGEVVERPASVIKELTENAIDAGATTVTVEIQNGGITFMRVTDNGCGIARADVPLAFLRHATSKITQQDDLAAIGTLGFRGEALASVCAMARVELLTRTEEELAGTRYRIEGGDEISIEDAGCPRGTTVLVRDLFFNTPARMKFLKKDVAEGNAVAGVMDKLALSHPEVSVRLIRDGRETLHTAGDGQLRSAIFAVYGRAFAEGLIPVSYRLGGVTVEGFVSRPAAARPNRSMQHFYINGRFVKSGTASAAVEQACRGAVMVGKFPSCVLHLHIPPEAVDVNVHPAKIEVRFLSERPIFDAVYHAVTDAIGRDVPNTLTLRAAGAALHSGVGTPASPHVYPVAVQPAPLDAPAAPLHDGTDAYQVEMPPLRRFDAASAASARAQAQTIAGVRAPEQNKTTAPPPISGTDKASAPPPLEVPFGRPEGLPISGTDKLPEQQTPPTSDMDKESAPPPLEVPFGRPDGLPISGTDKLPEQQTLPTSSADKLPVQQTLPTMDTNEVPLRFVGELFATYILLEAPDALVMIDKHAAHERILYEKLKKESAARYAQQLLTPAVIHPSKEELCVLLEHEELLQNSGFDVEEFGSGALLVRSAPLSFAEQDVEAALTEIAGHLLSHRTELTTAHDDWILHNIACRAAIKAGDVSSRDELLALARQLHTHPELRYCPHGRPIYLSMTRRELEKQFGRIP